MLSVSSVACVIDATMATPKSSSDQRHQAQRTRTRPLRAPCIRNAAPPQKAMNSVSVALRAPRWTVYSDSYGTEKTSR
jgi:cytochrome c biogenesis protein ResB